MSSEAERMEVAANLMVGDLVESAMQLAQESSSAPGAMGSAAPAAAKAEEVRLSAMRARAKAARTAVSKAKRKEARDHRWPATVEEDKDDEDEYEDAV